MIANNLTDKIHKSWINFIRKEYIDTPIMMNIYSLKKMIIILNGLNLLNQIM